MSDVPQAQPSMKKNLERWIKFTLLPPLGALIIRGIKGSMRLEQRGYEPVDALYREQRSIILAFWHAQQLKIGRAHV